MGCTRGGWEKTRKNLTKKKDFVEQWKVEERKQYLLVIKLKVVADEWGIKVQINLFPPQCVLVPWCQMHQRKSSGWMGKGHGGWRETGHGWFV